MKRKILLFTVSSFISLLSFAQNSAFFQDKPLTKKFVSINYQQSNIKGVHKDWIGIGGGMILEPFFLGLYGSTSLNDFLGVGSDKSNKLSITHGGLWVGYTMRSNDFVHLISTLRMGVGEAVLYHPTFDKTLDSMSDNITLIHPEIGIEFNLSRFLRFNVSLSYSSYDSFDKIPDYTNNDLNGFSPSVSLRIGLF